MTPRVLSAALVAGFWAALVASLLQAVWTTPLILQAERFEHSAAVLRAPEGERLEHHAVAPDAAGGPIVLAHMTGASAPGRIILSHDGPHAPSPEAHAHDDWAPQEGLERVAFTALASLVSGVGYALVLVALMLAAGAAPTRETCLRWALAGYVAVNLAPAVGLPPELPGMGAGGPLVLRQAWWALAVAATGLGLYLLAHRRAPWMAAAGLAALALPHLVGAPHGAAASEVPAGLAAQFATRSLAIGLVFWAILGLALSWAWARQERRLAPMAL
jgi:cobalt transporter subunit CbtA